MIRSIYSLFSVLSLVVLLFSACQKHETQQKEDHPEEPIETSSVNLSQDQMKSVGVEVGKVVEKALSSTLEANGTLRVPNSNKANVTAMFGGVMKALHVELGDVIRKGQVIATISHPQFIQLQEEYLNVLHRKEWAQLEVERQQALVEGNAGAGKNLQTASTEWNTLKTREASLRQQLLLLGVEPASLTASNLRSSVAITSPISGTVSNVYAKIGSYIDTSSPVAEIIENTALHLDLQVYEKDISCIQAGQKVSFIVTNSPHKTYSAEVVRIGSSFSDNSKTIGIHCRVIGDKSGLIDGMNITGTISLDNLLSAAVPNEAIVHADGKYYLFIVKEEEEHSHEGDHSHDHGTTFERIEITKGASQGGYTAITPALPIGTAIAVKGTFFINAKKDDPGEHGHAH